MKEKKLLKKVCRWHRISHNERLEGLISLYKDCLYIKIDSVYDDWRPRKTHCEIFVFLFSQYVSLKENLLKNGTSTKLANKIDNVLDLWYGLERFSFSEGGALIVYKEESNDNQ